MADTNKLRVALAGNPNCGKTTIFNNITGSRQHVGNYSGVTVEKKEGEYRHNGNDILFIDLPGTYSLTARSLDEVVARNVIINENPDMIVNVLDESNMERHLYLTMQLMELERPMVLVLNMADVAETMGYRLNIDKLSERIGAKAVTTVGSKNEGTRNLLDTIVAVGKNGATPVATVDYGPEVEPKIEELQAMVAEHLTTTYPNRWLAVKLLENDPEVLGKINAVDGGLEIISKAKVLREQLGDDFDAESYFQEARHRAAVSVYSDCIEAKPQDLETRSDRIDKVLTHRILGLPIFCFIMWLLFNLVNVIGTYPQDWLEAGFGMLGDWVKTLSLSPNLESLINDGIIAGVGAVLSFIPLIVLLFLGISFLEDTGYMARAAFVIDRIMRACGLHGKSFIPLLLGFGCSIPSIMGARILDNRRDRLVTILVTPFMICSARLPVYTLLTSAFFSKETAGTAMFLIYALGVILAVGAAKLMRMTILKGETEPFAMELPPYHMPTLKSVLMHMWERSILYMKKAGTFILAASILMWVLSSFPKDIEFSQDYDAAQETITQAFDQRNDQLMTAMGVTSETDKDAVTAMVDELTGVAKDHEDELKEAEAEDTEETADVEKSDQAESANPTADALAKVAEPFDTQAAIQTGKDTEVNEVFNTVKDKNEKLFPVAWAVYQNNQERDDMLGTVDVQRSSELVSNSYAAMIGKSVEPIMRPLGYDWKINVSLLTGLAAKEVIISTMGTIYSIEASDDNEKPLIELIRGDSFFTIPVGISMMIFILIYPPCLATMAVVRRETNSWKWPGFMFLYEMTFAWIGAYIAYHIALALGL